MIAPQLDLSDKNRRACLSGARLPVLQHCCCTLRNARRRTDDTRGRADVEFITVPVPGDRKGGSNPPSAVARGDP